MARVYLITGSNMGDRSDILRKADRLIGLRIGKIVDRSSIYESVPWGFKHPNKVLNQVLAIDTALAPEILLGHLQEIEKSLGRIRTGERFSARPIDIDILFCDDLVINSENLKIPHTRIQDRKFVLVPLNEIKPDLVHPVFNKTVKDLLKDCDDDGKVTLYRSG